MKKTKRKKTLATSKKRNFKIEKTERKYFEKIRTKKFFQADLKSPPGLFFVRFTKEKKIFTCKNAFTGVR